MSNYEKGEVLKVGRVPVVKFEEEEVPWHYDGSAADSGLGFNSFGPWDATSSFADELELVVGGSSSSGSSLFDSCSESGSDSSSSESSFDFAAFDSSFDSSFDCSSFDSSSFGDSSDSFNCSYDSCFDPALDLVNLKF